MNVYSFKAECFSVKKILTIIMKISVLPFGLIGVLSCLAGSATALGQSNQPTVTVETQSIEAIQKVVVDMAGMIQPELKPVASSMFAGIPLPSLDRTRPIGLAVWAELPAMAPQVALYLPVTGEEAFKNDFEAVPGMFGAMTPSLFLNSGYQTLTLMPDLPKELAESWSPAGFASDSAMESTQTFSKSSPSLLRLRAHLSDGSVWRSQGLMGINMARMGMAQAMSSENDQMKELGFDPAGFMQVMELYFKVGETLVRGMGNLQIDIGSNGAALFAEEQLYGVEGSDLAGWLKGGEWTGGLAPLLQHTQASDVLKIAMAIGKSETIVQGYSQLIEASMKMQGVEGVEGLQELFTNVAMEFFPMRTGGAVSLNADNSSLEWLFAYDFNGKSIDQLYPLLSNVVEAFKESGMVGPEKMYSAMDWKAASEQYAGVNIDRMTMELNENSPLLKMPGQKEMLEFMYGGLKVTQDYAVLKDRYVGGSPAKLRHYIDEIQKGEVNTEALEGLQPDEATCLYMSANLGEIISKVVTMVAMANKNNEDPGLDAVLKVLSAQKGDMQVKINLKDGLRSITSLPVRTLGSLFFLGVTSQSQLQ